MNSLCVSKIASGLLCLFYLSCGYNYLDRNYVLCIWLRLHTEICLTEDRWKDRFICHSQIALNFMVCYRICQDDGRSSEGDTWNWFKIQKSRWGLAVLVAYGGRTGFDVRKRYTNLSKFYGKKLHMRWLAVKLAKHLTLASLVMIAKIIC